MDSPKVLNFIYYTAKFLVLTAHSIDLKTNKIRNPTGKDTAIFFVVRIFLLTIFLMGPVIGFIKWVMVSKIFNIIQPLQDISMATTTVILFINWTFSDRQTALVLKMFLEVYQAISKKCTNKKILSSKKFSCLLVAKLLLSFINIAGDITIGIKHVSGVHHNSHFTHVVAYFMWAGVILLTDICFVAFLVIEIFYEHMDMHLRLLADKLKSLDEHHFSLHRTMSVLCDSSDELDECGIILSDIYRAAKSFFALSQFILFYSIFYNFSYLLMHLNESFYEHKTLGQIPVPHFVEAILNLVNLLLFILCVDAAVRKSRRIKLIEFDITCSGMDSRWDESVELFISQLNIESLDVKVFGLFELNNEFAILVLSGGVTYLFLLIQLNIMWEGIQDP